MNKGSCRKGIVFGIIFLFFSVGVQPAFAELSFDSDESELVEYTVQVGDIKHNVVLSSKQAKELENLKDCTKAKLNEVTTIKETSHIFDETVVSLNELGMIPDGMSVEDAQRMVKGNNRFPMIEILLNRLNGRNLGIFDDESNLFCLIVGETSNTYFYPISIRLILQLYQLPYILTFIISQLSYLLLSPLILLWLKSPIVFGNNAILGNKDGMIHSPSRGWIRTIGLNGINIWDGKFFGNIPLNDVSCIGIRGFTGLSIYNDPDYSDCFYLGYATQVKLEYD